MFLDEDPGAGLAGGAAVGGPVGEPRKHPLLTALETIEAELDGLLAGGHWQLPDGQLADLLHGFHRVGARVAAARGVALVEASDRGLAARLGAPDLPAWLIGQHALAPREARRLVRVARELSGTCQVTGQALATGTIDLDHARVICEAMRVLPPQTSDEQRARAEAMLLEFAATYNPYDLVKMAAGICESLTMTDISPGGGDPHADSGGADNSGDRTGGGVGDPDGRDRPGDNRGPAPDPTAIRRFTITDTPSGTSLLNGELDAEGAAMLRTAIDNLAAPRPGENDTPDPRSPARRRADALLELIDHALTAQTVPTSGGTHPHVSVIMTWEMLLDAGINPAETSWGLPLPRAALNRILCDCEITRIVLDPHGVPLDVGRTTRTIPPQIRKALIARDRGCVFPACDRPASWCAAHHVIEWWQDGTTSLDNLVLVCGEHHRRIHSEGWDVSFDGHGRPQLHPPAYIDPQRRPRQNPHCHRNPTITFPP
ncbi:HNH endonuclease signature motif containing protein [Frankia sp. AgB32]|uniref:HNH endonuclease signature motif containing protein n=1 Tax=Frankia sp. AgB32 TaxID=631119 RepID=UPI002010899D|nr:HNH endonuclease signature motif containing protein [Frankia sp. AgB32]MCK9895410.1 HNH endonuclease [Frankia sp. AgB32]